MSKRTFGPLVKTYLIFLEALWKFVSSEKIVGKKLE